MPIFIDETSNPSSAILLVQLMSDISEEGYAAGWLVDLEYRLWAIVRGGPADFGMADMTHEKVEALRRLAEAAGGWFYFDLDQGEVFVSAETWAKMYATHHPR